jgi:hypothetical protein
MFAVVAAVVAGLTASVWAAPQAKKYQVTGPVVEVADGKVVVMKGDEKWEIAIDKDTKVTGEMKVGAKVTIEYQMYAASVTVKDSGEAKAEPKKEEPKKK